MKAEILKLLRECEDYISGERLSKEFGVSRTAIWKYIHQLKEEGYQIESVTRKGYRLIENADRITASEILSRNHAGWVGKEIEYYEVTDSTNQRIREFAEDGRANGLLAVTEEQTGGKGRRGRTWISPKGSGIWMSLLLRPELEPDQASMVTVVAAVALAKTMTKLTELDVKIKWPNDIVVNKKKVSGILTEMSADMDQIYYIIVGIGINVNTMQFPDEIKNIATSIAIEKGECISRAEFIAEFCAQFERYYEQFLEKGNLSFIQGEYESYLINIGREVKIIKNRKEMIRKAIGINELGELIVEDEDGKQEVVFSGEVSVRGIYDYV
jgi:BirA family biotin operon repressor/biotin-[acetyl-CoA-carboxylase] ligase